MKKLLLIFLFLLVSLPVYAADVTLQWDANDPQPDGYRLFQRENEAYDYSNPVWEGQGTTATITNLLPGHTYYFVVRAFVLDNESGNSNEVSFLGDITAPSNLRISLEVSVTIDINGNPIITTYGN